MISFLTLDIDIFLFLEKMSSSGIDTGVNSPPPSNRDPSVIKVGTTEMTVEAYKEAKRSFDLFRTAISTAYPHEGYELRLNVCSAECVVKAREMFTFPFQPEIIKSHYVSFRLYGNNMDSYFAQITSQRGVENYFHANTPPVSGSYTLAFK